MESVLLSFTKRHNKEVCYYVRNGHSSNIWVKPLCMCGTRFGTSISKFEDKYWDVDIKNITVSHCDQTKCNLEIHVKFDFFLLIGK